MPAIAMRSTFLVYCLAIAAIAHRHFGGVPTHPPRPVRLARYPRHRLNLGDSTPNARSPRVSSPPPFTPPTPVPFRSNAQRLSQTLSLRTVLAAPTTLLVALFAIAIAMLSYRQSQSRVRERVVQHQTDLSRRIVDRLQDRFETPRRLARSHATAIELGAIDLDDWQTTGRHWGQQVRTFRAIALSYRDRSGGGLSVRRDAGNPLRLFVRRPTISAAPGLPPDNADAPPSSWQSSTLDPQTTLSLVPSDRPPPLLDLDRLDLSPAWTTTDTGTLAATVPVFTDGELQGAIAVETDFSNIRQYLRQLAISERGQAAVLDLDGNVLVSTSDADASTSVRQAALTALSRRTADLADLDEPQLLDVRVESQRYFLSVTPFRDDWGLEWLVLVTVPEADFADPVLADLRHVLLLGAIAVVGALVLSWQLARWLAQPIDRLAQSVGQLGRRQWQTPVAIERSRELSHLGRNFNRTAMQLQAQLSNLDTENAALRDADRLKDLYLNSLAEAFRKPQTEAIALVRELLDRPESYPTDDRQRLERVAKLGKRLLELTWDIADLTQIHSGQLQPTLKAVDMQATLDRVIAQHRDELDASGLTLQRHDFPPPLYVRADPQMLEQVLSVVLENAIQFTDTGSITVSTSISAPMGKTSYHELPEAIVTIADTGIGIDPEQREKLFQPFAKIEGCPEHRRGPGLGLAIAGNLMALMGGQIFIDSPGCGKGTTVKAILPILNE